MLMDYGNARKSSEDREGDKRRQEQIDVDKTMTILSERIIVLHEKYGWRSAKAWETLIREGKMPGSKEMRSTKTWYGLLLPGSLPLDERKAFLARRGRDFLPALKDYGAMDQEEVEIMFREKINREPTGTPELNQFQDDEHLKDGTSAYKKSRNCFLPAEIYSQYSWLADDNEVQGQIVLTKAQLERELLTSSLPRDIISFSVSHLSTLFPKVAKRGEMKGYSVFDSHGNEFICTTAPFSDATRNNGGPRRLPSRFINMCVICKGLMLSKYHVSVLCTCIPAGVTFSRQALQLAEGKVFSACWIHFKISGKQLENRS